MMTLSLLYKVLAYIENAIASAKKQVHKKNPESEEDLLEHRTDGTDAFDTLYIGCEKFPQHDFYGYSVGGVR